MTDVVEAPVVRGGTVQFPNITVTYMPTRACRAYRSSLPAAWFGPFGQDLDDGVFY
ncbi:hypothetical protein [Azospirillum brasilense]|uniref:hypothetical protein n=1 Tax=Azospirillum brasilense TaxID=192 RepID=UPI001586CD5E|nr:hypothetical protein [Azospirillum brasilense]